MRCDRRRSWDTPRVGGGVMPTQAISRRGARRSRAAVAELTPCRSVPREQLVEIQRSRLLAGAVSAVDELGYVDTTVSDVTSPARVSRRTFYELFANREECLAAVLEDVVALVAGEIAAEGLDRLAWRERVRGGLLVILGFLDREPALARVCVVQVLRGGPRLLGRREEIMAGLAKVVDEGRLEGARGAGCSRLTAEGVVGAAFTIVYARLLRGEREPLTGLLGELMGMVVLPYMGAAAARRELARPVPAGSADAAGGQLEGGCAVGDPLEGVPMRLTYRTARVLEGVGECPGASNREVAERGGIHDPGQVSKLLARLERLGLLVNTGEGQAKGEPNAWTLTPKGSRVAQRLSMTTTSQKDIESSTPPTSRSSTAAGSIPVAASSHPQSRGSSLMDNNSLGRRSC
jgi:AcrR family transcriptional regulator/DNA-binding MarR family transcriptional regulator